MPYMRKIFLVVLMMSCLSLQSQDLKLYFIAMPDSVFSLLTKVNREDFGDFLDSNMKAEVKNRFGNPSEMLKMTSDYLDLKMSSRSRVEMKLLLLNDSLSVVCVASTYQGPVEDSEIRFYDTTWQELPADRFLSKPVEDAFYRDSVPAEEAEHFRNLRAKADMFLCKAQLSADNFTLTFTYTTPDYLDKDTAKELKPFLRLEPLVYKWEDGRFR